MENPIDNDEDYLSARKKRNELRDQFEKLDYIAGQIVNGQIKKMDVWLSDYERNNPGIEKKYIH